MINKDIDSTPPIPILPATVGSTPQNTTPSPNKNLGKKIALILLTLIGLSTAATAGYYLGKNSSDTNVLPDILTPPQVGCTLEAKICPNGASVGRSGPNCEFAPCPDSPSSLNIVTITTQGGLCSDGQTCKEIITIDQDGTATKNDEFYKQLTPAELTRLMDTIRSTDFEEIKSTPFTGTCPTAYDGLETIYSFSLDSINEQVSTCQYQLSSQLVLFQQLNRLLEDPKLPLFQ